MTPAPLDLLGKTPYVLLTTFKRTGTPVPTPVWVVRDGDRLLVWTAPNAGKVKRIRHTSRVLVAPCARMGKPLGEPIEASAEIVGPAANTPVIALLKKKYALARIYLPLTKLVTDRRAGAEQIVLAIHL